MIISIYLKSRSYRSKNKYIKDGMNERWLRFIYQDIITSQSFAIIDT